MKTTREYKDLPRPTRLRIVQGALSGLFFEPDRSARDLADAARNGDWGIISEAALAQKNGEDGEPEGKRKTRQAMELAVDIAENPKDYGMNRDLTKREILDLIEAHYPDCYAAIPKATRTLTEWWGKVDVQVEQLRSYPDSAILKALENEEWD